MTFAVDHLLHAVNRPHDVRRVFERQFAWTGTDGGHHPDWGTYNELAYFDLSYIEWIGIEDVSLSMQSRFGREVLHSLSVHEGVGQFAFRTHDIDGVAADWAERGLPFWGPVDGYRTRPDGTIIRWRLLFPGQHSPDECALPFIIDWGKSDEERRESLRSAGAVIEQSNMQRLAAIHCLVHDVDELRARFEPYFGSLSPDSQVVTGVGTYIEGNADGVRLVFWEPDCDAFQSELSRYGEHCVQVDILSKPSSVSLPPDEARTSSTNNHPTIDACLPLIHGLRVRFIEATSVGFIHDFEHRIRKIEDNEADKWNVIHQKIECDSSEIGTRK